MLPLFRTAEIRNSLSFTTNFRNVPQENRGGGGDVVCSLHDCTFEFIQIRWGESWEWDERILAKFSSFLRHICVLHHNSVEYIDLHRFTAWSAKRHGSAKSPLFRLWWLPLTDL